MDPELYQPDLSLSFQVASPTAELVESRILGLHSRPIESKPPWIGLESEEEDVAPALLQAAPQGTVM